MRINSKNLFCLFIMAATSFLTATTLNSCTDLLDDQTEETEQNNSGDQTVPPSADFLPGRLYTNNENAPDNLKATIFYEALQATHLRDSLEQYIDAEYPQIPEDATLDYYLKNGTTALAYFTGYENETAVFPDKRIFKYTLFAVSDAILKNQYGINTLDDLRKKAVEVYGGNASLPDYSKESALYKLISYHILPCWLPYDQLNTSQPEIIAHRIYRDEYDVEDFYETMHPYAIMRISTPLDSKVEKEGIYINRKGTVSSHNLTHSGIRIWEPSEYGDLVCTSLNGGYHFIDKLLFFDDNTKSALNTRIRVMANTLSPDFINSGARGRLYQSYAHDSTNVVYRFKKGFCKNFECSDETNFDVRYRNKSFGCFYGDEMTVLGKYDISFRLPPVPESGTYEIRIWNYVSQSRGTVQYYIRQGNGAFTECRGPVDLTLQANDSIIGYIKDDDIRAQYQNLSENEIKNKILENDNLMRRNGYMKAMDCYAPYGPLRDGAGCYRIIIYNGNLQAGTDNYIRMCQTGEGWDYAFNFIEIVPQSVFNGNEDKH